MAHLWNISILNLIIAQTKFLLGATLMIYAEFENVILVIYKFPAADVN